MLRRLGVVLAVSALAAVFASSAQATPIPGNPDRGEPVCMVRGYPEIPGPFPSLVVGFGVITYVPTRAAVQLYAAERAMPKVVSYEPAPAGFVNDPALASGDPRLSNSGTGNNYDFVWNALKSYPATKAIIDSGANCAFGVNWGLPYPPA